MSMNRVSGWIGRGVREPNPYESQIEALRGLGVGRRTARIAAPILGCIGCQFSQSDDGELSCTAVSIATCGQNSFRRGEIHPILRLLEASGLLTSEWAEPTEKGNYRRRIYRDAGRGLSDITPLIYRCDGRPTPNYAPRSDAS